MKAKHTPAPWRYKATSGFDYGSTQYWVPGICVNIDTEADARLIASAPELLEALKAFVNVCDNASPMEFVKELGLVVEPARQAIAKAEGA